MQFAHYLRYSHSNGTNWTPQLVSLAIAIGLVFLTLWARDWWDKRKKAVLKSEKVITFPQSDKNKYDCYYYRLLIRNDSDYEARDVTVKVHGLTHDKNNVKDYLLTPLTWTHINKTQRNILAHRKALLDVVLFQISRNKDYENKLIIKNDFTEPFPKYTALKKGLNYIKLEIASNNSEPNEVKLQVEWPGKFTKDSKPSIKIAS